MQQFLASLKWIIVAFVAGGLIGGYTGWNEKSLRIDSADKKGLVQVRKDDVKAAADTQTANAKAEGKKEEVRTIVKYITKEIVKYVPETVYMPQEVGGNAACSSPTLNVGAVRLLDAARQGTPVDTSGWSPEEVEAPTAIGLRELAESDTEISGQYNELAADHDACVEYVQSLVIKQQARFTE